MRSIGIDEITNMGGEFNYINCECITGLSGEPEKNPNLANFNDFIDGFIGSNGALTIGTNQEMTSDYIPVIAGKSYIFEYDPSKKTVANYWCAMAYYNSNKELIRRDSTGETIDYVTITRTTPENTAYIKVSARFLKDASWVSLKEVI